MCAHGRSPAHAAPANVKRDKAFCTTFPFGKGSFALVLLTKSEGTWNPNYYIRQVVQPSTMGNGHSKKAKTSEKENPLSDAKSEAIRKYLEGVPESRVRKDYASPFSGNQEHVIQRSTGNHDIVSQQGEPERGKRSGSPVTMPTG